MKKWISLAALPLLVLPFSVQAGKTSLNVAMTLEPPGLDPTTGAAAAIAQITLYNIYEGLTRINQDATVSPMLAKTWTISDDGKNGVTLKAFSISQIGGAYCDAGQNYHNLVIPGYIGLQHTAMSRLYQWQYRIEHLDGSCPPPSTE